MGWGVGVGVRGVVRWVMKWEGEGGGDVTWHKSFIAAATEPTDRPFKKHKQVIQYNLRVTMTFEKKFIAILY